MLLTQNTLHLHAVYCKCQNSNTLQVLQSSPAHVLIMHLAKPHSSQTLARSGFSTLVNYHGRVMITMTRSDHGCSPVSSLEEMILPCSQPNDPDKALFPFSRSVSWGALCRNREGPLFHLKTTKLKQVRVQCNYYYVTSAIPIRTSRERCRYGAPVPVVCMCMWSGHETNPCPGRPGRHDPFIVLRLLLN